MECRGVTDLFGAVFVPFCLVAFFVPFWFATPEMLRLLTLPSFVLKELKKTAHIILLYSCIVTRGVTPISKAGTAALLAVKRHDQDFAHVQQQAKFAVFKQSQPFLDG